MLDRKASLSSPLPPTFIAGGGYSKIFVWDEFILDRKASLILFLFILSLALYLPGVLQFVKVDGVKVGDVFLLGSWHISEVSLHLENDKVRNGFVGSSLGSSWYPTISFTCMPSRACHAAKKVTRNIGPMFFLLT